jgi:regulator of sirC expression with transglutaminase-like and TPR domain
LAVVKGVDSCIQEFQKTGLSVQAPSSSDSDRLKVATLVRQIMKELSEAVPEEDKIMIITMMATKWLQEFIYRSKSYRLMQMAV